MNVPYVVPEDEVTPYPADFERVVQAVREMGYALDVIEKGRAAGAIFDEIPFLVSFDAAGRFLSIRALWESDLPAESAEPALFATADNWNREKYFPTVYTATSPEGRLGVYADFVVDTEAGLSDVQLRDAISSGISTGIAAIQYVKESASGALGLGESGRECALTCHLLRRRLRRTRPGLPRPIGHAMACRLLLPRCCSMFWSA